jgi:hypothetical protein
MSSRGFSNRKSRNEILSKMKKIKNEKVQKLLEEASGKQPSH